MEKCVNIISKHAKHRLRERSSISKRQNDLAIERGYSIDNFAGSFRRYLEKIIDNSNNINLIIYSNDIFLYGNNNVLITVLDVPSKYNKCFRKKGYN